MTVLKIPEDSFSNVQTPTSYLNSFKFCSSLLCLFFFGKFLNYRGLGMLSVITNCHSQTLSFKQVIMMFCMFVVSFQIVKLYHD